MSLLAQAFGHLLGSAFPLGLLKAALSRVAASLWQ